MERWAPSSSVTASPRCRMALGSSGRSSTEAPITAPRLICRSNRPAGSRAVIATTGPKTLETYRSVRRSSALATYAPPATMGPKRDDAGNCSPPSTALTHPRRSDELVQTPRGCALAHHRHRHAGSASQRDQRDECARQGGAGRTMVDRQPVTARLTFLRQAPVHDPGDRLHPDQGEHDPLDAIGGNVAANDMRQLVGAIRPDARRPASGPARKAASAWVGAHRSPAERGRHRSAAASGA